MNDLNENKSKSPEEEKLSSTFDPNTESIQAEMEELAKTFQEELDKTKAEVENAAAQNGNPDILIQDLEDVSEDDKNSEPEEIPEEELCACCEERRRGTKENPDSAYCEICDDGLRHYPFEFLKVFFVVVIIALVFYSGYFFSQRVPSFVAVHKADTLMQEGKMTSALEAYAEAANTMLNAHINGEMMYARELEVAYKLGYVEEGIEVAKNIHSWEFNLPHMKKAKAIYQDMLSLYITGQKAYIILADYDIEKTADLPYEEIIGKFDALQEASLLEFVEEAWEGQKAPLPEFLPEKFNPAMITFYKFYIASICEKDYAVQIEFLEQIKEEYPEYVWMYGALLGDLYTKTGQNIDEIAALLRAYDKDDFSADILEVTATRIRGDYDAAIAAAETIIGDPDSTIAYEMLRQQALCYLAKGEYSTALEVAQKSADINPYVLDVIETVALCAVANEKTELYEQMNTVLKQSGYEISQEVQDYKAGKITLDDILLKGDFDIA